MIEKQGNVYNLLVYRAEDVLKIKDFLYRDSNYFLIRKRDIFNRVEQKVKLRIPNSSSFKGITFRKKTRKWRAIVLEKRGRKEIGSFSTEKEAYLHQQRYVSEHPEKF